MKGLHVILLCLAILFLSVGGVLLFTQGATEKAPQPDIPRYTADQVIEVAKAYAGEECGAGRIAEYYDPKWTTTYLGDGRWEVTKDCSHVGSGLGKSTWIFYEATGELKK